ncbi:basic salivary proline-rich protein 2-like [Eptesicus fuscus]|uniref:basic salivary proline-rich protein 2-like n=1 Tax=Eptesicus fuscus TaxID=29078 RepID=UPI00240405ED|nr:basic salivary proline-rich protein 2-like [Eptesicus fuscus]
MRAPTAGPARPGLRARRHLRGPPRSPPGRPAGPRASRGRAPRGAPAPAPRPTPRPAPEPPPRPASPPGPAARPAASAQVTAGDRASGEKSALPSGLRGVGEWGSASPTRRGGLDPRTRRERRPSSPPGARASGGRRPPAHGPASLPKAPAPNSPAADPAVAAASGTWTLSSLTQPGGATSPTPFTDGQTEAPHTSSGSRDLNPRSDCKSSRVPCRAAASAPAVERFPRVQRALADFPGPAGQRAAARTPGCALVPNGEPECRCNPGAVPQAAPLLTGSSFSVLLLPSPVSWAPSSPKAHPTSCGGGAFHLDRGLPSSSVCLQRLLQAIGGWCRPVAGPANSDGCVSRKKLKGSMD